MNEVLSVLNNHKNWSEQIILNIANGKHYKSLLNKCIGYMPQKKLYKYYSFNSELASMHTGIGNTFGVSCFTESPVNMLLWFHYAKSIAEYA